MVAQNGPIAPDHTEAEHLEAEALRLAEEVKALRAQLRSVRHRYAVAALERAGWTTVRAAEEVDAARGTVTADLKAARKTASGEATGR